MMGDAEAVVRKAVPEDIGALAALWREMMDYLAEREPGFRRSAEGADNWSGWILAKMSDDKALVAVAEAGGQIAGFVIAMMSRRPPVYERLPFAEIIELAVAEDRRGSGVGRRLFEFARDWARARGADWLQVEVASANAAGKAFWRAVGFGPFTERMSLDI